MENLDKQGGIYKMKKLVKGIILGMVILTIMTFSLQVEAAEQISVYLNDEQLIFDVAPQIINGRTLLPLRTIFEALGLEVSWDPSTKVIKGTKENMEIILKVDNVLAYINNEEYTLDVPPTIIDSRTLVPARFIAESLGLNVEWDQESQTVSITNEITENEPIGSTENDESLDDYYISDEQMDEWYADFKGNYRAKLSNSQSISFAVMDQYYVYISTFGNNQPLISIHGRLTAISKDYVIVEFFDSYVVLVDGVRVAGIKDIETETRPISEIIYDGKEGAIVYKIDGELVIQIPEILKKSLNITDDLVDDIITFKSI